MGWKVFSIMTSQTTTLWIFNFSLVASHCRQKLAFLIDWFQGFLSKNVWQSIHSVSFNIKPRRIVVIVLIHETMHHPPRWKNTRYLFCYFVTSLYELSLFSVEKYLSTRSGIQYSFSSLVSLLSFVFWPTNVLYEIKEKKYCWLYLLILHITFVPKRTKK